ncbi:MAG TPA: hypothetical protein VG943_12840 [Caulobacterales bacterium]|nr:hypothetical protein [Caulobacterales bacterium]
MNLLFCTGPRDEPLAEVRMDDPKVVPSVGDVIQFDPEADNFSGDLCGRVTSRVFRHLPFHTEVDVIAEPMN